jgi:hypothetical protein
MLTNISTPHTLWLPRRRYVKRNRTRFLLEFGPTPFLPYRCAWCGYPDAAEKNLFSSFSSDWDDGVNVGRIYPGPQFVMDGYVALCDECQWVVRDHREPSRGHGIASLRPIRGCPIEILAYGYADDLRVADAVSQVWQRIPHLERRRIRVFLADDVREADDDGQPPVALGRLRIETLPLWPVWGRGLLGSNMACGHVIRVWATAARYMNQPALAALFAHEMAHTYQHATGTIPVSQDAFDVAARKKVKGQMEAEAQEIAGRWGFPDTDMGSWTK